VQKIIPTRPRCQQARGRAGACVLAGARAAGSPANQYWRAW